MMRVVVLAIMVVAACAGDDDSGHHLVADAGVDTAVPGGDLAGEWAAGTCASTKARRTLTATASSFLYRTQYFKDTDTACATPYMQLTVNETYDVGPAAATAPAAHEIDIRTAGTTLTIFDAATVADASSTAWCGYTDWQVNVAKDVAGEFCDPDTYWSVGHVLYDLYQLDGPRLYFGDFSTGTGTSVGTRPTSVLTSSYYTRQ